MRPIKKAENSKYCTCGSCYINLLNEANSLRYKLYIETKRYNLARVSLDAITWFGERKDLDSIRVRTYQYELGAGYLKNKIDSSIKNSFVNCDDNDCYGKIPLGEKNTILSFKIYGDHLGYLFEEDTNKRNKMWINKFRESEAYKLIKK